MRKGRNEFFSRVFFAFVGTLLLWDVIDAIEAGSSKRTLDLQYRVLRYGFLFSFQQEQKTKLGHNQTFGGGRF